MTLLRLDNRRKKFYQVIAPEMSILMCEWRKRGRVMRGHLPKEVRGTNPAKAEASSLAITSDPYIDITQQQPTFSFSFQTANSSVNRDERKYLKYN
jgi:hypothetical protein